MVTMTNQEYRAYVRSLSPTSPLWKDALRAFLTGGLICALGQLMRQGWLAFGLEEEAAGTASDGSGRLRQAGEVRRGGDSGAHHRLF